MQIHRKGAGLNNGFEIKRFEISFLETLLITAYCPADRAAMLTILFTRLNQFANIQTDRNI